MLQGHEAGSLLAPVTRTEIKAALWSIANHKSPGLDGFSSGFYKSAWSVVGDFVIAAVKEFFETRKLLKQVNSTALVLIPKIDQPRSMKEYRPLACCNVLFKIITKIMANRLREVMPSIISAYQGAFVEKRSLNHNVFLCQELLHKYGRVGLSPRCMIKVDIQKAYDTLN